MAKVFVSIGSNIDRYRHLTAGFDALQRQYGKLEISPVYESESVGFVGDAFLNAVVAFETEQSVAALQACLKVIEDAHGRERGGPKYSARSLDLDILCYDQLVGCIDDVILPRHEILHNAFVLRPMVDLVPDDCHPVAKKSYAELWQGYDQQSQKLWPVEFNWNAKLISVNGQ